MQMTKSTCKQQ